MVVDFTKMDGAGNDFVLIDNRAQNIRLDGQAARRLCDRHRGIGADGVILLKPCASKRADWAWDFYNSDGSMAEMCGNGARCFGRFVQRLTGGAASFTLEARAGVIAIRCDGERVSIQLTAPKDLRLNQVVPLSAGPTAIYSLDTGVPHAVLFVEDAGQCKVQAIGSEIRFHRHFAPRGTNVNFVQLLGGNQIRVRTYERGVEGETLACGTGVTASALVAAEVHHLQSPIDVQVEGGKLLQVGFKKSGGQYAEATLSGPADFVFEGRIEWPDAETTSEGKTAEPAMASR
ncbi:MAG TPA: diaminopimelate epimerase [Candidatus Saccharimonadales bacterium]|nr:diaminopimelate epimerase [Candidatus Saccharimonadales bacterium]